MRSQSILWFFILLVLIGLGVYFIYAPATPRSPASTATSTAVTFYCGEGNTVAATFATSSVALAFSDGNHYTLPQVRSGSGIRYEATSSGNDLLFTSEGASASFMNAASSTDLRYRTCTAAHVTHKAATNLVTYADQSNTFSFAFPSDFQVTGVPVGYGLSWAQDATTTGMELARIDVPKSYEPGTNFGGAWFTVGASSAPAAVKSCLANTSGTLNDQLSQVTINGTNFTKMHWVGAAAGNRYDTTSYRTVHGGECYAVEYTIHYGVLANYPPNSVQAFDEQKVQSALESVVKSFKFTS